MARGASFTGKVAIVTGGASGIGRALGAALAEAGAVVTLADIDGEAAAGVAAEMGGSTIGVALDVRDAEAVQALVDEVVELHGRIDLMVNNAGIVLGGPTEEATVAGWHQVVAVDLEGVMHGVLAAYPHMVRQGDGHIVNTASAAGLAPAALTPAYSAAKHGVVGLSSALRPEAARQGVRVTTLCPGSVDTPILDGQPVDGMPADATMLTGREVMDLAKMKTISPDELAAAALKGIARNKAVVVHPFQVKAIWYLQRLSPGLVERAGARNVRLAMAELAKRRA
jgi:NAD(P)-dependent dehydrogenase (short-subunit alcohol dehydrogenase family)